MNALTREDRELLDFLCSAESSPHCRVTSVRVRLRASLRRLRYAGLVWFDSFTPSASAMTDWRARQSPLLPDGAAGEVPPTPKAADVEGGAVARLPSAPPRRDTRGTSGVEGEVASASPADGLANGPNPERKPRTPDTAASTYRCGHPRTEQNSQTVGKGRGPVCRQCKRAHQKEWRAKRAEVAQENPAPRELSAQQVEGQRRAVRVRRQTTQKAMARIEQGLDARTAKQATVRHAQFALERELQISARMADPVEQAKQRLRKHYAPVVSMSVYGGAADRFCVGSRKDLTQEELLAMAGKVAA